MAIINGRRVNVPNSGIYGKDLKKHSRIRRGRRLVIPRRGIEFETIQDNRLYSKRDLVDKKGNPVRIRDIPDRTKGLTYGAPRSQISKMVITEQVIDIAENLFKRGVEFDEDNADWMSVPYYVLPERWHHISKTTPLLIVFPTEYPELPPVGCYLKADIPYSPNGHLFEQAYHEACKDPLDRGWKWYCVYVGKGNWKPARVRRSGDWRNGDNLWDYFTLTNEALASSE